MSFDAAYSEHHLAQVIPNFVSLHAIQGKERCNLTPWTMPMQLELKERRITQLQEATQHASALQSPDNLVCFISFNIPKTVFFWYLASVDHNLLGCF
jgi:hypothetical protein